MATTYEEKAGDGGGHPSVDTTSRFPTDALLRSKGFKIHSRHKADEAVWEMNGHRYGQKMILEALGRGNLREVMDAQYLEDIERSIREAA